MKQKTQKDLSKRELEEERKSHKNERGEKQVHRRIHTESLQGGDLLENLVCLQ